MTHPMIRKDAEELAGQYHESERSEAFRANWPDPYEYARARWPHFVEHVRSIYADLLTRNNVSQADKDKMYDALIEEAPAARAMDARTDLQLLPGSPVFDGDKSEIKLINKIAAESGELHRAAKRALLRSTRTKVARWE